MFRNIRISAQILVLTTVSVVAVLALGLLGVRSLTQAADSVYRLDRLVNAQVELGRVSETVRSGLERTVNDVFAGATTWEDAARRMGEQRVAFERAWRAAVRSLEESESGNAQSSQSMQKAVLGVRGAFSDLEGILEARDRNRLYLYFINDFGDLTAPLFATLKSSQENAIAASRQQLAEAEGTSQKFATFGLAGTAAGVVLLALLSTFVFRSISGRVHRIADTVQRVSAGDFAARTGLDTREELGQLAQAFDSLLDERVAAEARLREENDKLNDAVIGLLGSVARLAQRDLTSRATVTEDATGPVADALNLLADETAKVLGQVVGTAHEVAASSNVVKRQSDTVMAVSVKEHDEVEKATQQLAHASDAMLRIAKLAKASSDAADKAIQATAKAEETVFSTVDGITGVRDTIRETEKRIKRLGERSQEITGVVNLINSIAERTHILALNASMHAASAGEAGRGFAVVADEVQRLAQSARDATAQIAALVSSIQTETADTVATMNEAISKVVAGTQMAEQAGAEMRNTRNSTSELVKMVQVIAKDSQSQAAVTHRLRESAEGIRHSTEESFRQLQEQMTHTERLVDLARALLDAVSVFTLPASAVAGASHGGADQVVSLEAVREQRVAVGA